MALARRASELIRSCFIFEPRDNDDTQQIVNDRVPPVDGIDVPDNIAICNVPTSAHSMDTNSTLMQMFLERLEKVEKENEKLRQDNEKLKQNYEKLEAAVEAANARLDKQASQIESLRQAQIYSAEQLWRRHDVTYSSTYRFEEEEVVPQLSV